MGRVPRVTLGLPVYRGADYLAASVRSALEQTYEDFELIISDNASEDETEEIGREFASEDRRIRYVRHPQNIGAHRNYNSIVRLAQGELFKWMAHDDMLAPEFLERCVASLDRGSETVLAFTQSVKIDAEGVVVGEITSNQDYHSPSPYRRLRNFVADHTKIPQVFGVIRREVLERTPLLGSYPKSDTVFMYEMAMRGQFDTVGERLFLNREHPARQGNLGMRDRTQWYHPGRDAPLMPRWSQLRGFYAAVNRVPMPASEKSKCYGFATYWAGHHAVELAGDVAYRARYEAGAMASRAKRSTSSIG